MPNKNATTIEVSSIETGQPRLRLVTLAAWSVDEENRVNALVSLGRGSASTPTIASGRGTARELSSVLRATSWWTHSLDRDVQFSSLRQDAASSLASFEIKSEEGQ